MDKIIAVCMLVVLVVAALGMVGAAGGVDVPHIVSSVDSAVSSAIRSTQPVPTAVPATSSVSVLDAHGNRCSSDQLVWGVAKIDNGNEVGGWLCK